MKNKILTFIIGLLVGITLTTLIFLIYIKNINNINHSNFNPDNAMKQDFDGGNQNGNAPEKPENGQDIGEPPEKPGNEQSSNQQG